MIYISLSSSVRIVSSTRAGMGKSLYIKRLKEKLMDSTGNDSCEVIVPLHGPKVNADILVEALSHHFHLADAAIFHIDVSENVSNDFLKPVCVTIS